MLDPSSLKRPSAALSTVVALIICAGWIYVRTFLYHDSVLPITYVIPLMIAVWSRRRWQLWTMASVFFVASSLHFVLNAYTATTTRDGWTMLLTTLFNVVIGAGVIHGILDMPDNRDLAAAQLAKQNEQIL